MNSFIIHPLLRFVKGFLKYFSKIGIFVLDILLYFFYCTFLFPVSENKTCILSEFLKNPFFLTFPFFYAIMARKIRELFFSEKYNYRRMRYSYERISVD